MIVIAYYTDNYLDHIDRLTKSCIKFGLHYAFKQIEDQGGWLQNCLYKPTFIKSMLEKFKGPVLYVDADAEFCKEPIFDGVDCDIAVHTLDWGKYRDKRQGYFELLSGTVYFEHTQKAFEILNEWIWLCKDAQCFDQKLLDLILHKKRGYFGDEDLRVHDLPAEYCHIPEVMIGEPVILHHQASREVKRRENENTEVCTAT